MSNNGIPPLNDWQDDNYPVIYDEGNSKSYYVKTGNKVEITGGSSSYLVYTGTADAPDAPDGIPNFTIFANTVGSIVWSVAATGDYKGLLTGAFPAGKVWAFPGGNAGGVTLGIASSVPFEYAYNIQRTNDNEIHLSIYKTSDFSNVDLFDIGTGGAGNGLPFRIEVYP